MPGIHLHRHGSLLLFLGSLGLAIGLSSIHYFRIGGLGQTVSLTIITPHGDNVRQEIGPAFTAWYQTRYGQAPELNWIDQGGTSEDLKYVQGRYVKTPASIDIDLFFGGGTAPFRTLANAHQLQGYSLPKTLLSQMPEMVQGTRLYSDSGGWYGMALSSFGILFNRPLLLSKNLPEPRTWADLAEPPALGWVACVDPRGSGSAHLIYEIILQKYGWEKGWQILTRMAANSNHFTKGASGVLPLISSGEAVYSLAIDQYAWSLIEKLGRDRVGFSLPLGETVVTPDPVGLLKGAPHPLEAKRFMEFLFSESCQRLLGLKAGFPGGPGHLSLNRMSVLPKILSKMDTTNSFVRGNPFVAGELADWSYSDSLTESRWSMLNDALGLWMVDSHLAALTAWKALIAQKPLDTADTAAQLLWEKQVATSRFFRPPIPWETGRELAGRWKDESMRNSTMARWAQELHD